jgi:hypothetical protein
MKLSKSPVQELAFMFEKNKNFYKQVRIPLNYIKRLRELRKKSYIKKFPELVKLNCHSELSIEFDSGQNLNLEKLIKTVDQKIIPNGLEAIQIQPITRSVDIYRIFKDDDCAQRLRLRYDLSGNIFMAIIITTDLYSKPSEIWESEDFTVVARPECIYAFSEHPKTEAINQKEYLATIKNLVQDFLEIGNGEISHLVHKNTAKGKITFENNGGLRMTKYTQNEGVVGIGNFISFTVEESQKYIPEKQCLKENETLINQIIKTPLEIDNLLKQNEFENKLLKIEIESKGKNYSKIAADIAKQLLGETGLLKQNNFKFKINSDRGFSV